MPTWKLTRVDRDVKIRWPVDKPAASVIRTGVPIRETRETNTKTGLNAWRLYLLNFSSPDVAVVLEKRESEVNIFTVGEVLISR